MTSALAQIESKVPLFFVFEKVDWNCELNNQWSSISIQWNSVSIQFQFDNEIPGQLNDDDDDDDDDDELYSCDNVFSWR